LTPTHETEAATMLLA